MQKSKLTNRVVNLLRRKESYFIGILCTLVMYAKAGICGAKIGKNSCFLGCSSLHIGNGGEIVIGEGNMFISKETSNYIGLNHRCIISATPLEGKTCKLYIGDNCGFSGVSIWCFDSISIGNRVRCGANALIMDGDAHFDDYRVSPPRPIIIEDDVFIGANVVIKKGVTIGRNSVIGMNSVVVCNIPSNCVAVGNPAKVIKFLNK